MTSKATMPQPSGLDICEKRVCDFTMGHRFTNVCGTSDIRDLNDRFKLVALQGIFVVDCRMTVNPNRQ